MSFQILKRTWPAPPEDAWPLSQPLLSLTAHPQDVFTLAHALTHTACIGATGSGKTSGPMKTIAQAYMKAGFGGLMLCAKPGDAEEYLKWATEVGRDSSVIVIDDSGEYCLNLMKYILGSPTKRGGGNVENLVQVLEHVVNSSQGLGEQNETAPYWKLAPKELLSETVFALYHAYGAVKLDDIPKFLNSIPSSTRQKETTDFVEWSFCYETLNKLWKAPAIPLPDREAFQTTSYFGQNMGGLDSRTRSNVLSTVSAQLNMFQKGLMYRLFCTGTTFKPEAIHEGVIAIVDLPLKEYLHAGKVAQTLLKLLFQLATERRVIRPNTRPVFLFVDECQFFIDTRDLEFFSTARSSRAAALYATQNIPALKAMIGGRNAQDHAEAILGYFQNQLFLANTDVRTAQTGADIIGKAPRRRSSGNWTRGRNSQVSNGTSTSWGLQDGENTGKNWSSGFSASHDGTGHFSGGYNAGSGGQSGKSTSRSKGGGTSYSTSDGYSESEGGGWSEHLEYIFQPSDFASRLRTGGYANDNLVDAVFVRANSRFASTGSHWSPVTFRQSRG